MQKQITLNTNELNWLKQTLRSQIRFIENTNLNEGQKEESIKDINEFLQKLNG